MIMPSFCRFSNFFVSVSILKNTLQEDSRKVFFNMETIVIVVGMSRD